MKQSLQIVIGGSITCLMLIMASGCATSNIGNAKVDSKTKKILKQMSGKLSDASSISYTAIGYADIVGKNGELTQRYEEFNISMLRPDKLKIEAKLGKRRLTMWVNNGNIVILDPKRKRVAYTSGPKDIEEVLNFLADKATTTIPGADFLRTDPLGALLAWVSTGNYITSETENSNKLDHMLFTQGPVTWQLWVSENNNLPKRLLMTETGGLLRAQYEVEFSNWSTASISASQFIPDLPAKTKTIDINKITKALEL
jgi:hypothetical protein